MHSIGSKLSTQQNMTSATGKIMDSIARTCSSLNTGFIFFMLFAINLSSLSPVSYAAPVRKYRYLKFRPEALELYPIDCRYVLGGRERLSLLNLNTELTVLKVF